MKALRIPVTQNKARLNSQTENNRDRRRSSGIKSVLLVRQKNKIIVQHSKNSSHKKTNSAHIAKLSRIRNRPSAKSEVPSPWHQGIIFQMQS
jgi:hypothetical protein